MICCRALVTQLQILVVHFRVLLVINVQIGLIIVDTNKCNNDDSMMSLLTLILILLLLLYSKYKHCSLYLNFLNIRHNLVLHFFVLFLRDDAPFFLAIPLVKLGHTFRTHGDPLARGYSSTNSSHRASRFLCKEVENHKSRGF